MSRESAPSALAIVVMSETTVVSRSSEADGTLRGTGRTGSDSPGTTMPPIAAGPVDGLRAVLPAASPAAEMPGFGLDTVVPLRFRTTPGWPPCEPPPGVALPRAHHLHVARPPVRVYENAARKAQRIKGRPEKRNTRSGFIPLSWIGRAGRWHHRICNAGCNSESIGTGFRFAHADWPGGRRRRCGRIEETQARTHKTIWYRGAATKTVIHLRRQQILRNGPPMQLPSSTLSGALRSPRLMVVIGIPEESRSDALWRFEALPSPSPPRLIRKWRCPAGVEPTSAAATATTIGPRATAKAGSR